MKKIVCIDIHSYYSNNMHLTVGKIYDILEVDNSFVKTTSFSKAIYLIRNDKGKKDWFKSTRFISLNEYRKMKLQKIVSNQEEI